jgi:hypothetical protein
MSAQDKSVAPLLGTVPLAGDAVADLRRAQTLATWTDARFLDPLIGFLLPGVGDALGAVAGLYIVVIAARHRAPRTLIARMLLNIAVDCLGGVLPVVGDLFDALNRSNLRNVRLLERHLRLPNEVAPRGRTFLVVGAALALAAASAVALVLGWKLMQRLRGTRP